MSNEIADEIRELRKAKEVQNPVYVEVEVGLRVEQEDRDTLQGMLVQLAEANKLAATRNDLLAELVLGFQPRPRRARDRLPDFVMAVLVVYLVVIFAVQIYRAVR
jgi:hypothetical protein